MKGNQSHPWIRIESQFLSDLFGPTIGSINRWYSRFKEKGIVMQNLLPKRCSRWPEEVIVEVERHCKTHLTFFIEELKSFLKNKFPNVTDIAESTICWALNFDLQPTRTKSTKAARKAAPAEIGIYHTKLKAIYSFRSNWFSSMRRQRMTWMHFGIIYGRRRNLRQVWGFHVAEENRVCSCCIRLQRFFAGKSTRGTFTRNNFRNEFAEKVILNLNSWLLPS